MSVDTYHMIYTYMSQQISGEVNGGGHIDIPSYIHGTNLTRPLHPNNRTNHPQSSPFIKLKLLNRTRALNHQR